MTYLWYFQSALLIATPVLPMAPVMEMAARLPQPSLAAASAKVSLTLKLPTHRGPSSHQHGPNCLSGPVAHIANVATMAPIGLMALSGPVALIGPID